MEQGNNTEGGVKSGITLFEFYSMGIEQLIDSAPWELERSVSPYHASFLEEQRCMALTVLLMLGERQLPRSAGKGVDKKFEAQARASVNQAVFLRALKQFFARKRWDAGKANAVLERMQSYILDWRQAVADKADVRVPLLKTIITRVPPKDKEQQRRYATRVSKICRYVAGYVGKVLLSRYEVSG